jgi:hypothetical protein
MRGAILVGAAIAQFLSGGPAAPSDPRWEALRLVHEGRFEEADELLAGGGRAPSDPSIGFLRAFVTYWQLFYDSEDPALRQQFERRLDEAVAAAEARLDRAPEDGEAALWAGSARLLRAHLYAASRRPVASAFEAKRAKRWLERAGDSESWADEAAFGLGAYLYVADRVPALVKGVRALLLLPGGDRQKGLALLQRAASSSRFFSLDARLLLVTLCAHPKERLYEEALRQAEAAVAERVPALAALHVAGRLHLGLGQLDRAEDLLDRALSRAASSRRTAPSVVAAIALDRARLELARFRPDRALERLDPARFEGPGLPPGLARSAAELRASAAALARAPNGADARRALDGGAREAGSFGRALAALERERNEGVEASLPALLGLAESDPEDATWGLLAGRALLLAGRPQEAVRMLRCDQREASLPPPWVGPCHLLEGQAADLLGDRRKALAHYRKAERAPAFPSRDAARFYQQSPYRSGP